MSQATATETATAARHAIAKMVQPSVKVIVQIGRKLPDNEWIRLSRPVIHPAAEVVLVEMVGPGGVVHGQRTVDQGEAHAWCNDEIASAARRAAEGIIRRNPAWRAAS